MSSDPWTDPEPRPGDFDAGLATIDSRCIEPRDGDAKLRILVSVEDEDARLLQRIAKARGKKPGRCCR